MREVAGGYDEGASLRDDAFEAGDGVVQGPVVLDFALAGHEWVEGAAEDGHDGHCAAGVLVEPDCREFDGVLVEVMNFLVEGAGLANRLGQFIYGLAVGGQGA